MSQPSFLRLILMLSLQPPFRISNQTFSNMCPNKNSLFIPVLLNPTTVPAKKCLLNLTTLILSRDINYKVLSQIIL